MANSEPTVAVVSSQQSRVSQSICKYIQPSRMTVFLIIFFIISVLINGGHKPLSRRGFFCNDSSIDYPYGPNTISVQILLFVCMFVPLTIIKICDNSLQKRLRGSLLESRYRDERRRKNSDDIEVEEEGLMDNVKRRALVINDDVSELEPVPSSIHDISQAELIEGTRSDITNSDKNLVTKRPRENDDEIQQSIGRELKPAQIAARILERSYSEGQLFFFGCAITMFLTGIGKIAIGRLRPNFKQRCQPDVDCSKPENAYKYIEDFNCSSNINSYDINYISTSWPSGHASAMFYSMLYLAIYMNTVIPIIVHLSSNKAKRRFEPLALYVIYILMIGLAGYVSATRVSDYHHHVTDVLSGSLLGAIIAIVLSKAYLVNRYSSWIT